MKEFFNEVNLFVGVVLCWPDDEVRFGAFFNVVGAGSRCFCYCGINGGNHGVVWLGWKYWCYLFYFFWFVDYVVGGLLFIGGCWVIGGVMIMFVMVGVKIGGDVWVWFEF